MIEEQQAGDQKSLMQTFFPAIGKAAGDADPSPLATIVGNFYLDLQTRGFSRDDALDLSARFWAHYLKQPVVS